MTRIKKTLGQNWTRYHNYYGMTTILEAACKRELGWKKEMIRDYTINHAHEVNHPMAIQYAHNPPPRQTIMMMLGSKHTRN